MKIICISDTHGYHNQLQLPEGDVLVHAGDVSGRGHKKQIRQFLKWFAAQDFEHKIFIAGNHDFYFEQAPADEIADIIPPGVTYLNDSGTNINGINFWGSPVQPWFFDWAFNRQRGPEIDLHWDLIPSTTDILITHGPPFGILDKTIHGVEVGCERLLKKIELIKPRYSIFGHIHEGYGMRKKKGTHFINASSLDVGYQVVNAPVEIEV